MERGSRVKKLDRARYLIRLDDLCPTSNWRVFDGIERTLDHHGARPVVAVVPDNHDPRLHIDEPDPDFWDRIRRWQAKGWTIALHGYRHEYTTKSSGDWWHSPKSEFASLPEEEQAAKLDAGLAIFAREGIETRTWIAPNHTFDATTVRLLVDRGFDTISDGMARHPYTGIHGETWIPCQLWSFLKRRSGTWSVCLHPNWWDDAALDRFQADVEQYAAQLTTVDELREEFSGRAHSALDQMYGSYRDLRRRLR